MANKSTINIGFCISEALKDYGVTMNPSICFLLSNPLWLGLNTTNNNDAFFPIDKEYVSFINPLILEHFSVNANCLFIPVRGNAKEHYYLILTRLQNKKKVLVKISNGVLNKDKNHKMDVQRPILSLIYEIKETSLKKNDKVRLHFSMQEERIISKENFIKHWNCDEQKRINAEWFAIIPSKNKLSEELLIKKLKNAFIKQAYYLKPKSEKLITGYAVLQYLRNSLKLGTGKYNTSKRHQIIWRASNEITNDYSSSRLQFTNSLIDIQEFWEKDLNNLIQIFTDASNLWESFLNKNSSTEIISKRYLLKQYTGLITVEKELLQKLNQLIYGNQ